MDCTFIEENLEKLYLYSKNHTYTPDEADELTQEICVELLRSVNRMRTDNIDGWMWSVVRNTSRAFRRRAGARRATMVFLDDTILPDIPDEDDARDELLEKLRRKLLAISAEYREILVMHYFDGLPVEKIAEKTGIPSGTVKWRLSQGREKIRKDWDFEMEDTVIHPVELRIGFCGTGEYGENSLFPNELISDALSKNILWHCQGKGKTIEELSVLTGVPAYYIEDSLKNLVYREAVVKQSNRYVTDFMFIDAEACNRKAEELARKIYRKVVECFRTLDGDIWRNIAFSVENIFQMRKFYECTRPPVRYDGGCWIYMGWKNGEPLKMLIHNSSFNFGSDGTYYYMNVQYRMDPNIFQIGRLLRDDEINVCEKVLNGCRVSDGAFDEAEQEIILRLTERGCLRRTENGASDFEVTIPHLTCEQAKEQQERAKTAAAPVYEEFMVCADELYEHFQNQIPERFRMFAPKYHPAKRLIAACLERALREGLIELPKEPCCEFLIQHDKIQYEKIILSPD